MANRRIYHYYAYIYAVIVKTNSVSINSRPDIVLLVLWVGTNLSRLIAGRTGVMLTVRGYQRLFWIKILYRNQFFNTFGPRLNGKPSSIGYHRNHIDLHQPLGLTQPGHDNTG